MTQCEQVLEHIEDNGNISALDGFHLNPPVCAVHSRITDLRAQGYEIETYWEPGPTMPDGTKGKGHWAYRFAEVSA